MNRLFHIIFHLQLCIELSVCRSMHKCGSLLAFCTGFESAEERYLQMQAARKIFPDFIDVGHKSVRNAV